MFYLVNDINRLIDISGIIFNETQKLNKPLIVSDMLKHYDKCSCSDIMCKKDYNAIRNVILINVARLFTETVNYSSGSELIDHCLNNWVLKIIDKCAYIGSYYFINLLLECYKERLDL